ncbi:MAG: hypothetical protein HOM14_17745 [Gammaproteobacteria bacterium]|nr:hypothetical protein [Gammaproteobacteria bacterium]MBT4078926.1 hypothetical protein [Gammaproteobacteria bacterium]MBT4452369.1 hypothetical protein [Gammaproteobacteria bacterium]MBT4860042.1 hypothetical protein [Gammaproteobacteria bacterium]MBT6553197.1 hypothetical protein [Gammaproteobacteria bacterium]
MKFSITVFVFTLIFFSNNIFADNIDGRVAIKVSSKVKIQILEDMRKNLTSIQLIVAALANEDFEQVVKIAGELGSMDHTEEAMMRRKSLSEEYRSLGPQLHMGFQSLSRDARDFGDVQHSLGQLSNVMNVCVACHQGYRLEVE